MAPTTHMRYAVMFPSLRILHPMDLLTFFAFAFGQVSQLLVASVGIGSACFHCTLRHVEQQCDETPMVLTLLNWFHELFADTWEHNSLLRAAMPVVLVAYGLVRSTHTWLLLFDEDACRVHKHSRSFSTTDEGMGMGWSRTVPGGLVRKGKGANPQSFQLHFTPNRSAASTRDSPLPLPSESGLVCAKYQEQLFSFEHG